MPLEALARGSIVQALLRLCSRSHLARAHLGSVNLPTECAGPWRLQASSAGPGRLETRAPRNPSGRVRGAPVGWSLLAAQELLFVAALRFIEPAREPFRTMAPRFKFVEPIGSQAGAPGEPVVVDHNEQLTLRERHTATPSHSETARAAPSDLCYLNASAFLLVCLVA